MANDFSADPRPRKPQGEPPEDSGGWAPGFEVQAVCAIARAQRTARAELEGLGILPKRQRRAKR